MRVFRDLRHARQKAHAVFIADRWQGRVGRMEAFGFQSIGKDNLVAGDIQVRCRTILMQICESEDIEILKGVVSLDHVHMCIKISTINFN